MEGVEGSVPPCHPLEGGGPQGSGNPPVEWYKVTKRIVGATIGRPFQVAVMQAGEQCSPLRFAGRRALSSLTRRHGNPLDEWYRVTTTIVGADFQSAHIQRNCGMGGLKTLPYSSSRTMALPGRRETASALQDCKNASTIHFKEYPISFGKYCFSAFDFTGKVVYFSSFLC